MNIKKILMIILCILIVLYIILQCRSNDFDEKSENAIEETIEEEKDIIEPQEYFFDISSIDKPSFVSFLEKQEGYYYSNIELLEKDIQHDLMDANAVENDLGKNHLFVMTDSINEMISISYLVGRSRIKEGLEMEYLTYVNNFPTLCSVPEPEYPYDEEYQGKKDQQLLDNYYEASVDYWDSLEYYQIDIDLYIDAEKYAGTLLLNTWDGKITYNDEYTNENGIYMIVRGYTQGYNIESKKYFDVFNNPYVKEEDYGYYTAYFSDGKAVYCVSGKNNLNGFLEFLDLFGGDKK